MVATIGTDLDPGIDVPCCLTIWEVMTGGRGAIDLGLVADTARFAAEIAAADMDADGTDELMVGEGPIFGDADALPDFALLQWHGDHYASIPFTIPSVVACCTVILDVGDTDGLPGEEVLLTGLDRDSASGLYRVSVRDGAPWTDRATVDHEVAAARVVDQGPRASIVTGDGSRLFLWSWPGDGPASQGRVTRVTGGIPIAVFGSGTESRVLVSAQDATRVRCSSCPVTWASVPGGRPPSAGTSAAGCSGHSGPIPLPAHCRTGGCSPGGLRRRMPTRSPAPDRARCRSRHPGPVPADGPSPGLEPMGEVGEAGAWTALLGNFGQRVFGIPRVLPATDLQNARIRRWAQTWSPPPPSSSRRSGATVSPTFTGLRLTPTMDGTCWLATRRSTPRSCPPGNARWATRGSYRASERWKCPRTDGAHPSARAGRGQRAERLRHDGQHRARDPSGHAYSGSWRISVYRQPPTWESVRIRR